MIKYDQEHSGSCGHSNALTPWPSTSKATFAVDICIEKGRLLCTHLPSGNQLEPSLALIYPVIDDVLGM